MENPANENITMMFPKWFKIFLSIACIGFYDRSVPIFVFKIINDGIVSVWIEQVIMIILISLSTIYIVIRLLFYSVTAAKEGLQANNPFAKSKMFLWNEIVQVRRPLFRIPVDLTYVISINNKKIRLIRSMNNYREIVQAILDRAPNLKSCVY